MCSRSVLYNLSIRGYTRLPELSYTTAVVCSFKICLTPILQVCSVEKVIAWNTHASWLLVLANGIFSTISVQAACMIRQLFFYTRKLLFSKCKAKPTSWISCEAWLLAMQVHGGFSFLPGSVLPLCVSLVGVHSDSHLPRAVFLSWKPFRMSARRESITHSSSCFRRPLRTAWGQRDIWINLVIEGAREAHITRCLLCKNCQEFKSTIITGLNTVWIWADKLPFLFTLRVEFTEHPK